MQGTFRTGLKLASKAVELKRPSPGSARICKALGTNSSNTKETESAPPWGGGSLVPYWGYGYGFGHGGVGLIGIILIVLIVLLLMGRL